MTSALRRPTVASPSLERVAAGDLCAGCGACAALAPGRITMAMAAPGFLRPLQSAALDPEQEVAIAAVCPGLGQRVDAAGRPDDVLWGPLLTVRTGWATDPAIRFAGASGGALTALLAWLLDSGTVDAVVQVAADPDRPLGNVTVISQSALAVRAAAGSRYAPSAPLAGLGALLQDHRTSGRRFAVVGKPCDAAALRAWTRRDTAAAAAFPVSVSFFCGGVPSETGAGMLLKALDAETGQVTGFRYRGMGWPGRATARLSDGSERSMSYHDSWGNILSRHVQHRCKICADSSGMAADIVCADAWEVDAEGYPLFEEAPGVSLIVARTVLGERLVVAAEAAGEIESMPLDLAGLAAIQPGQRDRRRAVLARLLAQRLTGRPVPRYSGLNLWRAARQATPRRNLQSFLGMMRRLCRRTRLKSTRPGPLP
jgi:coenzyme F420 hydrogenase subunit beta